MIKKKPTRTKLNAESFVKRSQIKEHLGEVISFKGSTARAMSTDGWFSGRVDDVGETSVYLGGGGTLVGPVPLAEIREIKIETLSTKIIEFERKD